MFTEHHTDNSFRFQRIGALLKLFLIESFQACSLKKDLDHSDESGNLLLRNFRQLVDERFKDWHKTGDYADALHVSADHLNRVVKSYLGKTAKEYIQSRITTGAKRLLFFSELSQKEIAFELGFSEVANFNAFFRKCTGSSPGQFRNSLKKQQV